MAEKPETARWFKVNLHQWEPLALCVGARPSRSGRAGELVLQLVDSRLRKKEWTEGVLTPGDLGLDEENARQFVLAFAGIARALLDDLLPVPSPNEGREGFYVSAGPVSRDQAVTDFRTCKLNRVECGPLLPWWRRISPPAFTPAPEQFRKAAQRHAIAMEDLLTTFTAAAPYQPADVQQAAAAIRNGAPRSRDLARAVAALSAVHALGLVPDDGRPVVPDQLPMLIIRDALNNQRRLALFTSDQTARAAGIDKKVVIFSMPVAGAARYALADESDGVVLDYGTAQALKADKEDIRALMLEASLPELAARREWWTVGMPPATIRVPGTARNALCVFTSAEQAQRYGQESGINAEGASWVPASHIRETILAAKGRLALVVDMGAADAVAIEGQYLADFLRLVSSEPGTEAPETDLIGHLAQLCADNRPDPLSELEKAVARSLGLGNAPEVWGAMAALEQIWVLRDREGNLVSLQPYIALFTSAAHAEAFIAEIRRKKPNLPPISPVLVPARPLFKSLSPRQPAIAINPDCEQSWIGLSDTLPQVLAMAGLAR